MKKKPATDKATGKAKVAFNGTLTTGIIKVPQSNCDDESYVFPDNVEQATDMSTYQSDPNTSMQPNPAYRMAQSTDEMYEIVK